MGKYLTAIDLGSSKIAVAAGLRTETGIRIASYHDAPSSGITHGEILNDFQVESVIKELVAAVAEDIDEEITDVVVGIGAKILHSDTKIFTTTRALPQSTISDTEIDEISRKRFNTHNANDEVVLEAVPQRYNVDDYIGLDAGSLKGMSGKEIETQFHLVFGKADIMSRRRKILDKCGLTMRKAILSPIAAARAVMTEPEMENGAILVDIGKGTTEIVVVKDNLVREVATIPFGGESITQDIKNVTNITAKWAEDVKTSRGCCVEDDVPENSKFILKDADSNTVSEIDGNLLARVIEARTAEILEAVRYTIDNSPFSAKLPAGVVLTGGTAHLGSIRQLAQAILGRKVRLAAPRTSIASGSVEDSYDTYASVAVGLVLEGFEPQLSHAVSILKKSEAAPEAHADSSSKNNGGGLFKSIFGSGESDEDKQARKEAEKKKEEDERKRKEEEKARKEEEKKRKAEEKRLKEQKAREEKEAQHNNGWGDLFSGLTSNPENDNV